MKRFKEDLNTAIFTTRSILYKHEAIQFVFHHEEDGAWEFIGKGTYDEHDYIVISLEEIIKLDKSVLNIADLPLGFEAFRSNLKSEWIIKKSSTD